MTTETIIFISIAVLIFLVGLIIKNEYDLWLTLSRDKLGD